MTNVPAGQGLHALIVNRVDQLLPELFGDAIRGEWLTALMTRLGGALSRIKRVHFTSPGSSLAFQEKLVARHEQAMPAEPSLSH